MRTKIQNSMSKEAAMNLLGLSLSTEGKKKRPKQIQLVGSASIDFEFDATANVAVLKKPGVNVLSDWKLRILY